MAYTLIVNPGSSSKKYSLVKEGVVVSSSRFERSATGFDLCVEQSGVQQKCEGITDDKFSSAISQVLSNILSTKIINDLNEINFIGVRVVAPGTYFQKHQIVDDLFLHRLRKCEPAAPLHIPHTLQEIEMLRRELPAAQIVAVSDSAFHRSMPARARDYSIERHDTHEYDLHRFGYHGISVASVLPRVKHIFKHLPEKLVVAHIGSGVSMTALKNGESIDTTMGFSPDSGMVMGTRAGDLDAGVLLELMRVKNMKTFDALSYVQKRGGLKGMSGEADFRLLLERVANQESNAEAALEHFVYKFKKQLGASIAALGGIDALILTATASERSPLLRQYILSEMEWCGIELDEHINETVMNTDAVITKSDSIVKVAVIRTQELSEMIDVVESFY